MAKVTPLLIVSVPLLVIAAPSVFVQLPDKVRLLKVPPLILCVVPFSTTLLEVPEKVPLLDQFPLTVKVLDPEIVSVAPELMVRLLHTPPAAPIMGWLPPEGMVTFVEAVGIPPHQLDAVFQSVFVVPYHVPDTQETVKIPVAVDPK